MPVPVHQAAFTSHSPTRNQPLILSIQLPHVAITDDVTKGLVRNEVRAAVNVNTDLVRLYARRGKAKKLYREALRDLGSVG